MIRKTLLATATAVALTATIASSASAAVEVRDPANGNELCPDDLGWGGGGVSGGCTVNLIGVFRGGFLSGSTFYNNIGCNANAVAHVDSIGTIAFGTFDVFSAVEPQICGGDGGWDGRNLPWLGQITAGENGYTVDTYADFGDDAFAGTVTFDVTQGSYGSEWTTGGPQIINDGSPEAVDVDFDSNETLAVSEVE